MPRDGLTVFSSFVERAGLTPILDGQYLDGLATSRVESLSINKQCFVIYGNMTASSLNSSPSSVPRRHRRGLTRSAAACERCRRRKQKVSFQWRG